MLWLPSGNCVQKAESKHTAKSSTWIFPADIVQYTPSKHGVFKRHNAFSESHLTNSNSHFCPICWGFNFMLCGSCYLWLPAWRVLFYCRWLEVAISLSTLPKYIPSTSKPSPARVTVQRGLPDNRRNPRVGKASLSLTNMIKQETHIYDSSFGNTNN